VEIVLIAVLAVVAVAWSFAGQQQQGQQQQAQQDELTAPLIEDASRYADNTGVTVSPLWSHMISSKADSYQYSRV
jgi:lipopolysaccharide export system protein LptC